MNPTERYIKMCEKAKEIQKEWKHEADDYFAVPKEYWYWIDYDEVGNYAVYIISRYETDSGIYGPNPDIFDEEWGGTRILDFSYIRKHAIWLPTQEQLQEMTRGSVGEKIDDFYWWVVETFATNKRYRDSLEDSDIKRIKKEKWTMNELWLAFVMREKYHKVWDDEKEEWIEKEVQQ